MFRQFSRPQQTRNPALIQTTQLLREKFSYVSPFSELEVCGRGEEREMEGEGERWKSIDFGIFHLLLSK